MKTTIELPDDLLTKAKVLAAQQHTSLKEIMIQGLKLLINTPLEAEEKQRKATLKRLLAGMKAANTEPMSPLKREEIYDR